MSTNKHFNDQDSGFVTSEYRISSAYETRRATGF